VGELDVLVLLELEAELLVLLVAPCSSFIDSAFSARPLALGEQLLLHPGRFREHARLHRGGFGRNPSCSMPAASESSCSFVTWA